MSALQPLEPGLRLASINIEGSKHLSRVAAFLGKHSPDVACIQELMAEDIPALCEKLGYAHHIFAPMTLWPDEHGARLYGVGIFSRLPLMQPEIVHYFGDGTGQEVLDRSSAETKVRTCRYVAAIATVILGESSFAIATTHFPWTLHGSVSDHQRLACERVIALLDERPLIFCGDFNAPRGGETFSRLAEQWHDNIPQSYTSSIDPRLHRSGALQLMVDGLFSTHDYRVHDVVLHQDVSDHCAITATVMATRPSQTIDLARGAVEATPAS
jgi:endonuclease/exonuclease/phosphatase family metal-dependent hydrolase